MLGKLSLLHRGSGRVILPSNTPGAACGVDLAWPHTSREFPAVGDARSSNNPTHVTVGCMYYMNP